MSRGQKVQKCPADLIAKLQVEADRTAEKCQARAVRANVEAAIYQERVDRYQLDVAEDCLCPRCWVRDDVKSQMKPSDDGDTDAYDIYRCRTCGFEENLPN